MVIILNILNPNQTVSLISCVCRVSGGELFYYLSDKDKVSEVEAAEFLLQILEGVKCLHNKGILHLDLKVCEITVYFIYHS